MFCFFKDNELVNFWSNSIGDIFADLTCNSLKWDKAKVDLVFYWGLEGVPEHYEFDSNKKLIIKKRHFTQVESQDENGNVILNEVESFTVEKEIEPDFFMSKGLIVKPC